MSVGPFYVEDRGSFSCRRQAFTDILGPLQALIDAEVPRRERAAETAKAPVPQWNDLELPQIRRDGGDCRWRDGSRSIRLIAGVLGWFIYERGAGVLGTPIVLRHATLRIRPRPARLESAAGAL